MPLTLVFLMFCPQLNRICKTVFKRTFPGASVNNGGCVCLSGGHGGAAAGVYVEEARVRAAEAPGPSAETSLRGDRTAVWVPVSTVSTRRPADMFPFVCAAATEHINCSVKAASRFRREDLLTNFSLMRFFSNQFLCSNFIKSSFVLFLFASFYEGGVFLVSCHCLDCNFK